MLNGKSAIITGSSRGIGREIAITYAKNGANLIINGNNMDKLNELKLEIEQYGVKCGIVQGDISNYETSKKMANMCIDRYGRVDILVNNAGVNKRTSFLDLSIEEWDQMISINLSGVFYACKCVIPCMIDQNSGSIINISSTASKTAHPTASISYGASKAGVNSMTQKLASDMAGFITGETINVNGGSYMN